MPIFDRPEAGGGVQGAFIGEVRLPASPGHFDVGAGRLAGVARDPDYGIERVR